MDSTLPQSQGPMIVAVDHYAVSREDRMLCARLAGSFAVCISDEVFEAGALLHMQAGRPGRAMDPELTDNTLSMDLLLLDRCLTELRALEPQAKHWQARFFAHADPAAGGEERLAGPARLLRSGAGGFRHLPWAAAMSTKARRSG